MEGLVDAAADLAARGVPLVVRLGRPDEVVPALAAEVGASLVVGDENPVRIGQQWREQVARRLEVPFHLVDADVVVPTSLFPKEEFAARTLRPKIHRVWDEYLKPLPSPERSSSPGTDRAPPGEAIDADALMAKLKVGGVSRGRRLSRRHARGREAAAAVRARAAGPLCHAIATSRLPTRPPSCRPTCISATSAR